jgi:hypothetical protein
MNDNRSLPASDLLVTNLLKTTASIEAHLTTGMNAFLMKSGATQQFVEVMTEFIRPLLQIVAEMEKEVIRFARNEPKKAKESKGKEFDLEM